MATVEDSSPERVPSSELEKKVTATSGYGSLPLLYHKRQGSHVDGKLLTQEDISDSLACNFRPWRKWMTLVVIAFLQISMNLNASIMGSASHDLVTRFGLSETKLTLIQGLFLIAYAFGCELWAPWSEESGRWRVLQWSLGLVNLFQIPQLAVIAVCSREQGHIVGSVLIFCRFMGGLSSAGGSVTLGVVADMWGMDVQQSPTAALVFASVAGSIVGPVLGGFLISFAKAEWVIATQLIFGVLAQAFQFLTPETRASVIMTIQARKRRAAGELVWSPAEIEEERWTECLYWKRVMAIWYRPFHMLCTEPIVLFLSLISGFSDALTFTFLDALPMVMAQWSFSPWQTGLCFLSIGFGYCVSWLIWCIEIQYWSKRPSVLKAKPELRLRWLLWTAPALPAGMYAFAWAATGPPRHWIVPNILLVFVGIANYAIYGSTVDYMIAAYGEKYSASATGGNGFMRDFLAGVSAFYARRLYSKVGPKGMHLQHGSNVLASIALPLVVPIFLFFYFGRWARRNSKYAREVQRRRDAEE